MRCFRFTTRCAVLLFPAALSLTCAPAPTAARHAVAIASSSASASSSAPAKPPPTPAELEADLARGWTLLHDGRHDEAIALLRAAAISWRVHAEQHPAPADGPPCAPGPASHDVLLPRVTDPFLALLRAPRDRMLVLETCKGVFVFDADGTPRAYASAPRRPVFVPGGPLVAYETGVGAARSVHVLDLDRLDSRWDVERAQLVAISDDGRFLSLTRDSPRAIEVRATDTGAIVATIPLGAEDEPDTFFPPVDHAVGRAPTLPTTSDGTRALVGIRRATPYLHGTAALVDLVEGAVLFETAISTLGATSLLQTPAFFSPKEDLVAFLDMAGTTTIVDAKTGKTKAKRPGCAFPTNVARFTTDGHALVVGAGRFVCGFMAPSLAPLFRTRLLTEKEYDLVDMHADVTSLTGVAHDAAFLVESYMSGVALVRVPSGAIAWRTRATAKVVGGVVVGEKEVIRFDEKLKPIVRSMTAEELAGAPIAETTSASAASDDEVRARVVAHACAIGGWLVPREACPPGM